MRHLEGRIAGADKQVLSYDETEWVALKWAIKMSRQQPGRCGSQSDGCTHLYIKLGLEVVVLSTLPPSFIKVIGH